VRVRRRLRRRIRHVQRFSSDTFKTQVGSSACEICPANSVIVSNASTSVITCTCVSGFQPNYINGRVNKGMKRICLGLLLFVSILHDASAIDYVCTFCPIGKYKSATSNNESVNCPANTNQDITAATSPTQCKPCPSNSYAPAGSGRNTQCLCGLGYTGDVTSYSTGPTTGRSRSR
jgi:hypothetical protein